MKRIFVPLFLTCLLLLYVSHHLDIKDDVIHPFIIITFFCAVGCYFLKKFKWSYVFIVLAVGLLITARFAGEKENFYRLSNSDIPSDQYITVHGRLTAFPEIGSEYSYLYLETEHLEFQRKKIKIHLSVRIKVKGNLQHLHRGDRVTVDAKLYRNRFNRNFYPNGMEDYVLYKKNHFNGYCKSSELVMVEARSPVWKLIGEWRNKIRDVIEEKYTDPGGNPAGVLDRKGVFLQAILLGERTKLEGEQKDRLLSAGVFHLLAISGAHIGIIALFSLLFLKFVKVPFRQRYIAAAVILIIFLVLSGFKISAERAVLMALLIFIARIFYLGIDIFNIISFCGLLILIRNPAQFLDAGFILTFTLTAAIVAGREIFLPLMKKWKKPPGISNALKEFLSANISASMISLPLSLFFFKRYSFAGFVAGLFLLPLTAVITGLGILLIPLAPLSTAVSRILLAALDIPLTLFFYVVDFFSPIRGSFNIFRASPSILVVVVILAAFFLLSAVRTNTHKIILGAVMVMGICFISLNLFFYSPQNLEVFYLDVGQGDSQVVVFPGGDALLIDGGGTYYSDFQVGRNIVLPFLLQKRIKIKWVAVSHFHPDHVRGITEIIPIIKPEELWISAEAGEDSFYDQLMAAVPPTVEIKKLHAPFTETVGSCTVEFLYPKEVIKEYRPHNNHSQVLRISDGYFSFLFPGDIEHEVETDLAGTNCAKLRADVLKVPHHGSRTSSTPDLLDCVKPRWAVFSYGHNNRFRFPHREVMRNYKSRRIKTLSTARSGGIRIVSLPGSIKIETTK
jgi:competence protein ComEC